MSRGGEAALVGLPSGQRVAARELMSAPWRGRKVVLLGDTCNSEAIMGASRMPAALQPLLETADTSFMTSMEDLT